MRMLLPSLMLIVLVGTACANPTRVRRQDGMRPPGKGEGGTPFLGDGARGKTCDANFKCPDGTHVDLENCYEEGGVRHCCECLPCASVMCLPGRKPAQNPTTGCWDTCVCDYGKVDGCGTCQPTCKDPSPVCPENCRMGGCDCPKDRPIWDGDKQMCITLRECPPPPEPQCRSNMVPGCEPADNCFVTCKDPSMSCPKIETCFAPGCVCPDDAPVWDGEKGLCVTKEQCPLPPVCTRPQPMCDIRCEVYKKDSQGCMLCECECPMIKCAIPCEFGYETDGNGCQKGCTCLPSPCQNTQCPPGQTCQLGKCVDSRPNPCSFTTCLAGTICQETNGGAECVALCSTENTQCPPGQTCQLGKCVDSRPNPCSFTTCLAGTICQETNGGAECVALCSTERPCPRGQMCEGGRCVANPCAGQRCGPGLVCTVVQQECTPYPCPPVAQCVPDGPCFNNKCPRHWECVAITARMPCTSPLCSIFSGRYTCRNPCGTGGLQCPVGRHCEATSLGPVCVMDQAPPSCREMGCPRGQTCRDVVCIRAPCPPQCVDDTIDPCESTSCPENQVCKDGRCFLKEDCTVTGCPRGQMCEVAPCFAPPCPHFCRDNDRCMNVNCTAGTHCERGQCVQDENPCHLVDCRDGHFCEVVNGEAVCSESGSEGAGSNPSLDLGEQGEGNQKPPPKGETPGRMSFPRRAPAVPPSA